MQKNEIVKQPGCEDELNEGLLTVAEAQARILDAVSAVSATETLPVREALERVLAGDIVSPIDVPSHINSAMDGYAVRAEDLPADGVREFPMPGTSWAGRPWLAAIEPGQAVQIMTGGMMPEGADTVVMQEHVERDADTVRIGAGHKPGQNVRAAGEDVARGQPVFTAGKRLTSADIGVLASLGLGEVSVYRRLKVAFFSTGDELRAVGEALGPGEIYDSNRYTLHGMLARLNVESLDMGVIADTRDAISEAFQHAASMADVVITTGGVSVGEADFVKEILAETGSVDFWKLAIKPGRPLAFGTVNDALFFGLPGNPVAVMVTFYEFVQPALRRMMGQSDVRPARFKVRCQSRLRKRPGRMEFQRGHLEIADNGDLSVSRSGAQGSGMLSSMSTANCFIVLPTASGNVEPGDDVYVEPFEGLV